MRTYSDACNYVSHCVYTTKDLMGVLKLIMLSLLRNNILMPPYDITPLLVAIPND